MILGLVPARGGSKRVPGKNMRYLNGQRLVIWAVGGALCSSSLDRVAVSSENEEIRHVCKPFCETIARPGEMASDGATSYPLMLHALDWYRRHHEAIFEYLCLLQPTSPFRAVEDIEGCIEVAMGNHAAASFTEGEAVPNGAVYVGHVDWLRDGGNFDSEGVRRYDMPVDRSLDIDTELDWAKAEALIAEMAV